MQATEFLHDAKTNAEVCPLLADTLIDREVQRVTAPPPAPDAEGTDPSAAAAATNPEEINAVRILSSLF